MTSISPSLTLSLAMSHHEGDKPPEQEGDIATADKTDVEQSEAPQAVPKKKGQLKYLLLLAAALLAIILVTVLVQKPTNFDEYLKSSGYMGVFMMALIGSASPVWPLPGSWAIFIAAGLGLNPIILGANRGIGESIGELTGYTAGFGGQVALQRLKQIRPDRKMDETMGRAHHIRCLSDTQRLHQTGHHRRRQPALPSVEVLRLLLVGQDD